MGRLRIGFLLPTYSSRQNTSLMPVVMRLLTEAGVTVDVIRPVPGALNLASVRVEHHLYVLKKVSGLALSLAGALHAQGAAIVNPYPATVALHDKIIGLRMLQAAGVPVPETHVTEDPVNLASLLDRGPLIVKPFHGSSGHGVRIVRSAAELSDVPDSEPVLAQRYHPPQGPDRKLFVIGDRIFGVMKAFPRRTESDKHGEPFAPTADHIEIARRCGQALGVDLYGVDIIESDGTSYVVDMNSIPGFKGVPDAPALLARYLHAAAERAARGQAPGSPQEFRFANV